MNRRTLIEYLDSFLSRDSEVAYADRRGYRITRWSYRQVAEAAFQFARELEARHIKKEDRVMIWGTNCAEWVISFFGCLLRGVVVVPMDAIASADFAQRVARQVSAKLLVCSREQAPTEGNLPTLFFDLLLATISRHPTMAYPASELQRSDAVEIVFTSGTTAEPKGVMITHGNVLANLEPLETEIQKYLKYERIFHPIRFLNLVPLSHVFGQFLGIFTPQLLGGTVIFQDTLNPNEIIRTIKRERVSVLVAVPRLLDSLQAKIERDYEAAGHLDWFKKQFQGAENEGFMKRFWRFRDIHKKFGWKFWAFISGGATLNPDTEAFWTRLSFAVIQGYGLTETTSLISLNHPFQRSKGSIGQVLPGRELKLSESGEILVRGESVATKYWQGEHLKPVAGDEGWFHTGDIGAFDEAGNLYFKGRKKDVIITSAGMNIYPADLEAALRRQPEVQDCLVVGIARDGNAEPCAVMILGEESQNPGNILQRANSSLAEYQHMRLWFVWPERDFPRTATQKPRVDLIQAVVQTQLQGHAAQISPQEDKIPRGPLGDLIARISGRTPTALSPDLNLTRDLNLSSIDQVELLSAIEDRYQIELSESEFTKDLTVGQLEQMISRPPAPRTEYKYPRWTQRWPMTDLRLVIYYLLVWPATMLMAYPAIRGRENLRGVHGPVLVISNHITMVDIGFILAALPPRLRHRLAVAMEGERLEAMRHPPKEAGLLLRWVNKMSYALVVGLFNAFPLPQGSGFRGSFAFAGETVDRGYSVLVFPEGERTKTGQMASFRAGIGLLAKNLNIPIIPMRIDGLYELKINRRKIARPGVVKVTIGPALQFHSGVDPREISRNLETRVASL